MNWYIVYGRRFFDIMGDSDCDVLGIIQLNDDRDVFVSERPSQYGNYIFNETHYHEFEYEKIPILNQVDLEVFKIQFQE